MIHVQLFLVIKRGMTLKEERWEVKIGTLKSSLLLPLKTRKVATKYSLCSSVVIISNQIQTRKMQG